jgi:hypothetical protein
MTNFLNAILMILLYNDTININTNQVLADIKIPDTGKKL